MYENDFSMHENETFVPQILMDENSMHEHFVGKTSIFMRKNVILVHKNITCMHKNVIRIVMHGNFMRRFFMYETIFTG